MVLVKFLRIGALSPDSQVIPSLISETDTLRLLKIILLLFKGGFEESDTNSVEEQLVYQSTWLLSLMTAQDEMYDLSLALA